MISEILRSIYNNENENKIMTARTADPSKLLIIPSCNGMMRMRSAQEIKYISGSGPVSAVHLQCGQVLKSTRGLVHYQRQLEIADGFYRFSQSLLVNLHYVDGVHTRKQQLILRCGLVLPISRRCCQQYKKWCRSFDQADSSSIPESVHDEPNIVKYNIQVP